MDDTNNQEEKDLSKISEVELIKKITKSFKNTNKSTIIAVSYTHLTLPTTNSV